MVRPSEAPSPRFRGLTCINARSLPSQDEFEVPMPSEPVNVLDDILSEGEGLDFLSSARLSREASVDIGAVERLER